ncbi:MAG: methyltransferase domain-containing protein, partial [Promethearchaeota archaeon]
MTEQSHKHKNHQWTDDHAERFVQSMETQLKTRYQPFAKRIAKIYQNYENVEAPKIMDLACGPAYLLMEIQKQIPSASLLGVDSSEKMLNYAKQKMEQYNLQGIEFKQGMAENLPIESNSYSVITCLNSFHDFKDPKKALSEVFRVL